MRTSVKRCENVFLQYEIVFFRAEISFPLSPRLLSHPRAPIDRHLFARNGVRSDPVSY